MTEYNVGDEIEVGEFFWIGEDRFIGVDEHFNHGQNTRTHGSVDVGCTLVVRGVVGDDIVVSLRRNATPYGVNAAIGSVFTVSSDFLARQLGTVSKVSEEEKRRSALALLFCGGGAGK